MNRLMEDNLSTYIERFRNALLDSQIGNQVLKIVWFGSSLKGQSHEQSDVDILIVSTDGAELSSRIADITLDIQMENRCPIEIITASIDDLYPIHDHFLANVLAYGKEVYSMPDEDLRFSAATHYLSLAQEYLHSSEDAVTRDQLRLGLDGAYNAAELAVKGLLLLKISDLPGSHGAIVQRFGESYLKPGLIDRALGRRLNQSLEMRNQARYKFSARISKDDALSVVALAKSLIDILEDFLGERHLSHQNSLTVKNDVHDLF